MYNIILPAKAVSETVPITIDFSDMLQSGESLNGCGVMASLFSGTDPSPQNVVDGNATYTASSATQNITGGVVGNTYTLSFLVTTSNSHNYMKVAKLAVIESTE